MLERPTFTMTASYEAGPEKILLSCNFKGFRHIIQGRCRQNAQIELRPVLMERSPFSASKYITTFFFNSKKKNNFRPRKKNPKKKLGILKISQIPLGF